MKQTIQDRDEEIETKRKEVEIWNRYRDHGTSEHAKQIELLELELVDLQTTHQDMCSEWWGCASPVFKPKRIV